MSAAPLRLCWRTIFGISLSVFSILWMAMSAQPAGARGATDAGVLKWLPWVAFGGTVKTRERAEMELWAPLAQDSTSVLFAHVQGKLFEADAREGNLALGYRQKLNADWVGGIWAGYDIRRSPLDNTFHQAAGGLELLSRNFDIRVNGYLPVNRTETVTQRWRQTQAFTTTSVAGGAESLSLFHNQVSVTTHGVNRIDEHALYGVDGEIGVRLPLEYLFHETGNRNTWLNKMDVRLFAGGYYFDSKEIEREILGTRLRLEWKISDILPQVPGSDLTFKADYQYDPVQKEDISFGLRVRLPFGNDGWGNDAYRRNSYLENRMADSIHRDTDIITAEGETSTSKRSAVSTTVTGQEAVVDAATGVRLDRIVEIDANDNVNAALETAGSNSLIVASNAAGAFRDQGIRLVEGQTLMGGGRSLSVVGAQSGVESTYSSAGSETTIIETGGRSAITVASNTHVTGLRIEGGGQQAGRDNRGIRTADRRLENIHIDHVSVANMGGQGVRFDSHTENWSLTNSVIRDIWSSNAIDVENLNRNFLVADVAISNVHQSNGDAFHFSANNQGTIRDTVIGENIAGHAMRFRDDNVIEGSGNVILDGNPRFQFFGRNNLLSESLFANAARE
jgi:Inverse autotransporter, beta-domain